MKLNRSGRRRRRRFSTRVAAFGATVALSFGATTGCTAVAGHATIQAGAAAARVATGSTADDPAAPTTITPTTITQTMTYTATVTPGATDPAADPAAAGPGTTTVTATPDAGDDQLYKDTSAAVSFTEGFWNDTFTGWDVVWHGPSMWAGNGFYDSTERDNAGAQWWTEGPVCAGDRAAALNAFFCTDGEVAWDRALLREGYAAFGHSFVYVTVAHEWAHAAQQRFIADGQAPAVLAQQELQADCLAGTTIAGAVKLGYLQLEIGDTDKLTATLEAMGDERTWRTPDDHGSGDERASWFRTGFNGDIEACLGNR